MARMKQDLDLAEVMCRALHHRDERVVLQAFLLLFPGEEFVLEKFRLEKKDGRCPYISDVAAYYDGKLLMKRTSTTKTGFHQHYESQFFDNNPKSK